MVVNGFRSWNTVDYEDDENEKFSHFQLFDNFLC